MTKSNQDQDQVIKNLVDKNIEIKNALIFYAQHPILEKYKLIELVTKQLVDFEKQFSVGEPANIELFMKDLLEQLEHRRYLLSILKYIG